MDSGGQGLVVVLKGAFDAFLGKEIDFEIIPKTSVNKAEVSGEEVDITFGYCTEFIVMLEKKFTDKDEAEFKSYLESIGDSIVCVADDEIVKIHVHTNDPGLAIQKGLSYGSLTSMKIDNMREEHHEKVIKDAEKKAAMEKETDKKDAPMEPAKEYGFISVSAGEGLSEIFRGLGADHVIEGGQTMNPSTEDMLKAIDKVNAKNIFILPNNSNIILAASQAASICEDKNIIVVPTKTIPQGISAMISFEMNKSVEDNLSDMEEAIGIVKTGQVTYAVRDTVIDDKEIKENDIMGIGDKTILAVGKDITETTLDLIDQLVDDSSEFISIYYGSDVSEEDAEKLMALVEETYPDIEIALEVGGQPIYYYILSVE